LIGFILMFMLTGLTRGEERLLVRLSGNAKIATGDLYKQVYGNATIYPEARFGVRLVAGLEIWLGFGFANVKGTTTATETETKMAETQLMLGLGYLIPAGKKMKIYLEAGYLYLKDKETALNESVSGDCSGFVADLGLIYKISKTIGISIGGGYLGAKDHLGGETIDFGGIKASLGLQLMF